MSQKYKWKTGYSCPVSCEVVVQRIETIRARSENGKITAKQVVDDARPKNSVLHSRFEWNDRVGGEKYREIQARQMIRCIEVVEIKDDGAKESQVGYVSLSTPFVKGSGGYQKTTNALSEPMSRELVLNTAWAQLESWKKRWGKLKEFADIVDAIDRVDIPVA